MDKVYISWNPVNWATVLLMAFLGWAVFSLGIQFYRAWFGPGVLR
jgi:hypothetical protein